MNPVPPRDQTLLPRMHACGCAAAHGDGQCPAQFELDRFERSLHADKGARPDPAAGEAPNIGHLSVAPRGADAERLVLIRGGIILSMDPGIGNLVRGDILIRGTRIAAIAPHIEADATVVDARDKIVMPGFCDPHIHAWQGNLPRLIGNHVGDAAAEMDGTTTDADPTRNYRAVMHERFGPLYEPEDIYIGTLMSLLAALNGGITTVCDNAHNSRTPAHTDASIAALRDAGIRGVHAFGRPRMGRHAGHFPHDAHRLRRDYFASNDSLLSLRLFMLGRDPTDEVEAVANVRRDLDLWITFDSGIGRQPLDRLYGDGILDGRETINHGTFVSPEQMRLIADHGAMVNVCPRIETQFRFGDIPYQAWRDQGVRPAISNDDPVTYAINMFQEMRTLYGFQRAQIFRDASTATTPSPQAATQREMLEAATIHGAANCALSHVAGSLTPGKQADLIMIDTDNIHLFPPHNAACTVVQGADVSFVDTVFVAGRLRKWQGRLLDVDFPALKTAISASRDHLFSKAQWPLASIDLGD